MYKKRKSMQRSGTIWFREEKRQTDSNRYADASIANMLLVVQASIMPTSLLRQKQANYSLSTPFCHYPTLPNRFARCYVPFIDNPGAGLVGSDPRGLFVLSVNGKG